MRSIHLLLAPSVGPLSAGPCAGEQRQEQAETAFFAAASVSCRAARTTFGPISLAMAETLEYALSISTHSQD